MNIDEVRQEKMKLEKLLFALFEEFRSCTGVRIDSVQCMTETVCLMGDRPRQVLGSVRVWLEEL